MKWIFVYFISMLLTGCSLWAERTTTFASVSTYDIERLQFALRESPIKLREAITTEAKARPNLIEEPPFNTASLVVGGGASVSATLSDLLLNTRNPFLLPDTQYTVISNVISDRTTLSFVSSISDYLTGRISKCRQPVLFRYFQNRYMGQDQVEQCSEEVPFYVVSSYDGAETVWIDPKKVSSIHLLFAGHGEGFASRFGHVSLRLVICPEGTPSDATCNANLPGHLVLGFGAYVNDLELDMWKGLTGGYQAHMFASRFMDVYQDYAIREFREIYSLPLLLDKEKREQMVRELSEIHWSYSGEYRFLTKNCTSLLQQALRALSPECAAANNMTSNYLRPDHFFEAIKESSLVQGEKLTNLEIAERDGNFFSSTKQYYDKAIREIKGAMTVPAFNDLEGYLGVDPVVRRQAIEQDKAFLSRLHQDAHLLNAQLILEELAVMRGEKRLMALAAIYFQNEMPSKLNAIHIKLNDDQFKVFDDCLLKPIALASKPYHSQPSIPKKSEIPPAIKLPPICSTAAGLNNLKEALAVVNATDPDNWSGISTISKNLSESNNNVIYLKNNFATKVSTVVTKQNNTNSCLVQTFSQYQWREY